MTAVDPHAPVLPWREWDVLPWAREVCAAHVKHLLDACGFRVSNLQDAIVVDSMLRSVVLLEQRYAEPTDWLEDRLVNDRMDWMTRELHIQAANDKQIVLATRRVRQPARFAVDDLEPNERHYADDLTLLRVQAVAMPPLQE